MLNFKELLNNEQKEAVFHVDGPLLVLAGAGTGKTRVITYKIAYLINNNIVQPENILAVTFTNKAANEMKDRLLNIIGNRIKSLWIGTFHSIALRILKRDAPSAGLLKEAFTVIDQEDRLSILNTILKELNIDKKQFPSKQYLHLISNFKNELAYIESKEPENYIYRFKDVFYEYQKYLIASNMIDFDDMLSMTVKLFMKNKDTLEYYRMLYKYILVDEYQDTNVLQFYFIKLLCQGNVKSKICVVGDDDQAIYSWRGAEIKNILEFDKHFTSATIIKLTTNYRSTQNILDIAGKLISHNQYRNSKQLITQKNYPGIIEIVNTSSEDEEALFITNKIKNLIKEGIACDEIAILYRTNAQSRIFETYLSGNNIPYKVIGNISFYQRKEIKDILSYLKIYDNPYDLQSFLRSLKFPSKGIGDVTINKIIDHAHKNDLDLLEAVKSILAEFNGKQRVALEDYLQIIECIIESPDIAEMIKKIIKRTNYDVYIKQFEEEYLANKRINNIYELVNAAALYKEYNSESQLSDFLATTTLTTGMDETNNIAVNLITVHSAKGLEFDTVFLAGLEEGLFPLSKAYQNNSDFEEERRLCYVAITRAKHRLFISWAKSRLVFGTRQNNSPSIFLKEMRDSTDFIRPISKGSIVVHDKFGKGIVLETSGRGDDARVEVAFKSYGTKKIVARYLKTI